MPIRDYDRPGEILNKSQLQIYRPRIEGIDNERQRPVPRRITRPENVKPAGERNIPGQRKSVTTPQNNRRTEQQSKTRQEREYQRQDQQVQQRRQTDRR